MNCKDEEIVTNQLTGHLSLTVFFTFFLLYSSFFYGGFFSLNSSLNAEEQPSLKPLKILVCLSHFPLPTNTFILNQITGLIDEGHHVDICAKIAKNPIEDPRIETYNLLKKTKRSLLKNLNDYDLLFAQFGSIGARLANLKYQYPTNKPQRSTKTKLVTCFRGHDISAYLKRNPNGYATLMKEGDLFLPVCEAFRKKLIQMGAPAEKVKVIHSGINTKKFSFKERKWPEDGLVRIATTCRLTGKKGLETAIKAVCALHKRYPSIDYTIIGEGDERAALEKMVNKREANSYIHFAGLCSSDKVLDYLHKSHLFLHPSETSSLGDQEGIPNAIKEAMATGMAVVSTSHSGIPELVEHGVSGFLVEEGDAKGLTHYLLHLIHHPQIWGAMGRAGRKKIEEEFDSCQIDKELVATLKRLMEDK